MAQIIYIYKQKDSDSAWSSVISELGCFLRNEIQNLRVITLNNSNLHSLRKSMKSILNCNLVKNDILVFNHAITFWLLLPLLVFLHFKGIKLIYLCHEHEHILGVKYLIRYFKYIKVKEFLRHFKFWYRIPFFFSNRVVCLSSYQAVSLGVIDYDRISYLGIDKSNFPSKPKRLLGEKKPIVMFAHDPNRFDKGHRFCLSIFHGENYKLVYGRDRILSYDEVYKKYHDADIVFLPSDCESFSLVLAESLATNSCIVTNANVGIIQLLLGVFTVFQLESYGLFICNHDVTSYRVGLDKATSFITNNTPSTLSLFDYLNLDSSSSFNRLSRYLKVLGGGDV